MLTTLLRFRSAATLLLISTDLYQKVCVYLACCDVMSLHLSSTTLVLLTCGYPTLCAAAVDAALSQAIPQPLTPAIQLEQAVVTIPETATGSIDSPPEQAAPQVADDCPQPQQDQQE